METWQLVWRRGFVPFLSTPGLLALKRALQSNDPALLQGTTSEPPPLQIHDDWPVERACALALCGWRGNGLATVGEVETYFAEACWHADQALGEPAACRYFLNWFDDTPREEMRERLLAEVNRALAQRGQGPDAEPGKPPSEPSPNPSRLSRGIRTRWHRLLQALENLRAVLERYLRSHRLLPRDRSGELRAGPARPSLPGILVVDDEPAIRTFLQTALPRHGFKVFSAASGQEALAVYRLHRAEIAAVLLDVQLPGLDGPQTLRILQAIDPQVRCCFMSGGLGVYSEEELLDLGAVRVIRKPFRLAEVLEAFQGIFHPEE